MSIDVIAGAAAGPFAAACVLLAFAGISKVRHPVAAQPAVTALGLPATASTVRALGVIEIGVAGAGLAFGGLGAVAVAAVYGALAIAAWRLLVRSPGTACGCLGASEAPVTVTHIVVNVAALLAAAFAAAGGAPLAAAGHGTWSRVALVLFVVCAAWLGALLLDALPALNAAVEESGSR